MGRFFPLVSIATCLAALAACTIERDVPLATFACSAGGPCPANDAAIEIPDVGGPTPQDATPADAQATPDASDAGGSADADLAEAGPVGDVGVASASCEPAMPLPSTGIATGTTLSGIDHRTGFCDAEQGGPDDTYFFTVNATVATLSARTAGSDFDTVLYAYREQCAAASDFDCSDDDGTSTNSLLELGPLSPGTYYLTVDGYARGERGGYILTVAGLLARGSICDPNQAFLACPTGTCVPAAGDYRCREGLDCVDGFDTDGDGDVDEDTCINPPVVTCPAPANVRGLLVTPVQATATDDGRVVGHHWSVTSTHAVLPELTGGDTGTVMIRPRLAGTYRLRYEATDDALQTRACETTVQFVPDDLLHIELTWPATPLVDLDLHLLDPAAQAWFDGVLDCEPASCDLGLEWGGPGAADDPRLFNAAVRPPGGERIEVLTPAAGTYRVGVHFLDGPSGASTRAHLRVYCGTRMIRDFEATLRGASPTSFWKAADITISSGACTITPLTARGGGPLLVDEVDAETTR